jgi:hypothetical protein
MQNARASIPACAVVLLVILVCPTSGGVKVQDREREFGPVVRAYLGYLRNEQEVVDDRVSRREISHAYYRRNSNRIRALREMALRLARQTNNDYLPELEAIARDEFGLLFQKPPRPELLRSGEILQNTFRFMGAVRSTEVFYIFARLDPYEQSELMEKPSEKPAKLSIPTPSGDQVEKPASRARRIVP